MRRTSIVALALMLSGSLASTPSFATTSSSSVSTPFGGNGHNVSFDGRLFIVRRGPDAPTGGWFATLLRPENLVFGADGMPQFDQGAFSPYALIQPFAEGENALAICQPAATPTPCDEAGNAAAAGPYACYDTQILDSDAYPDQINALRRRSLKLWVSNPGTGTAEVYKWEWGPQRTPLAGIGGAQLRGIEPTVSRDGKLLVWQGHPQNNGEIDVLMYATNSTACGLDGWDGPHNLGRMFTDPKVNGVYPLGERALRAADGSVYGPNDVLRGGYPWLFPDGEAVNFTSITVPCRANEDPPGCGPRRGGLAVIGYPTNWSLAHIDGGVNPNTDQTVRLFFSSPGPDTFTQLPVTPGVDVWPMFGSNTQNYAEFVFDDGLDGRYAGVWHLNEMVDRAGNIDLTRTPDVSGYFNTGFVRGATFPTTNIAPTGKAMLFDGVGAHIEVPHDSSLDPVNAITIQMRLRLDADPDCDGANNYRVLLGKGDLGTGSYSIVLEDSRQLHGRVNVGGEQHSIVSTLALPLGVWTELVLSYVAQTGELKFEIDGMPAGVAMIAPGTLTGSNSALTIGGPGGARAACPAGDGAFAGAIDEVRISRFDRNGEPDPDPGAEPDPAADMGADLDLGTTPTADLGIDPGLDVRVDDMPSTAPDGGESDGSAPAGTSGKDGGCSTTNSAPGLGEFALLLGVLLAWRRRR